MAKNPFKHPVFLQGLNLLQQQKEMPCQAAQLFHRWIHQEQVYKHIYQNKHPEIRQDFVQHYSTLVGTLHACSATQYQREIIELAIAPKDVGSSPATLQT